MTDMMTIAPQDLRQRLRDIIEGNGRELAFLDVREDGQRGMAHPLLSVCTIPPSR